METDVFASLILAVQLKYDAPWPVGVCFGLYTLKVIFLEVRSLSAGEFICVCASQRETEMKQIT